MAKKFKFSLDVLKRYRESRLNSAKKELAAAESLVFDLSRQLRQASIDRSDFIHQSINHQTAGVDQVSSQMILVETLRIRKTEDALKQAEEERDRHTRWVQHLGRELRAIERLEEKKLDIHNEDMRLQEKKLVDGWVAEHWTNRGKEG
jgi:hypothetical protein